MDSGQRCFSGSEWDRLKLPRIGSAERQLGCKAGQRRRQEAKLSDLVISQQGEACLLDMVHYGLGSLVTDPTKGPLFGDANELELVGRGWVLCIYN